MAKRQERSAVQNLIDSANLAELARLSGMSEDAALDALTAGVSGTNLSALELDRKQYIDALAAAVRQDDRDKKAVAKIVKQLRVLHLSIETSKRLNRPTTSQVGVTSDVGVVAFTHKRHLSND